MNTNDRLPTTLSISRGPRGLRLHLPSGRSIDISATAAGARFIEETLRGAEEYERTQTARRAHIGAFPTQAIADIWERQAREREAIAAQVEEVKERKAEEAKAAWRQRGIDPDALEFRI